MTDLKKTPLQGPDKDTGVAGKLEDNGDVKEDRKIYQGIPPKEKGLIREIQPSLCAQQELEAIAMLLKHCYLNIRLSL